MEHLSISVLIFALTGIVAETWQPLNAITDGIKTFFKDPVSSMADMISSGYKSARKMANSFSFLPTKESQVELENPEEVLTAPSIIVQNGFPCETHTVKSEGYLLNIHRIPRSKNHLRTSSKTVLLHHGVLGSSTDWLLNGENSLAYFLADAGYDVWMANMRGNRYSREHAWLNKDSKAYWNFSWHEVALHDLPAVINYIMTHKGGRTRISYIGHSMGTTILFSMLSLRPEYNNILNAGVALAPIAFFADIKPPLKHLASLTNKMAYMEMARGIYEFRIRKLVNLGRYVNMCDLNSYNSTKCKELIFFFCGRDESQLESSRLQMFLRHVGSGTSWKTMVHFAQQIISGKFQQFDYGSDNMQVYGSDTPPEYHLGKVYLPVLLIWALNDPISSQKDVEILHNKLPVTAEAYLVPFKEFNHLDYLWAKDAPKLVNIKILEYLRSNDRVRGANTKSP